MNSFPFAPKQTVVFVPSKMKVKQSPYCKASYQPSINQLGVPNCFYLFLTTKEEVIGMNAVGDGTSNEGHPMKYHGGLIGVFQQQLAEDIEHNSKYKK